MTAIVVSEAMTFHDLPFSVMTRIVARLAIALTVPIQRSTIPTPKLPNVPNARTGGRVGVGC